MGKHFSFIHCADLHLGEPFGDIRPGSKGPWNEQIGKATFKAFEKVVDAAIENRTDAILISGDVYNSNHHSLAAQMAFARELYRAAENGIETLGIMTRAKPGRRIFLCLNQFISSRPIVWNRFRWFGKGKLWPGFTESATEQDIPRRICPLFFIKKKKMCFP